MDYSKNPAATQYEIEGTYCIVQAPLPYLHTTSINQLRSPIPHHVTPCFQATSFLTAQGEITRGRVRVKPTRADPYYSSRSLADIIAAVDARGQCNEDLEDEESMRAGAGE